MDQTYSYEVVVKNSAKAVIVPLKDGIGSISRVYKSLMAADVHPITGHCSNYSYIRQQIVQACQSLQRSDQAAMACLRCLDENLGNHIQEVGTLEQQRNATKYTLDDLRTKQASDEKLLLLSQEGLKQAETNVKSTRDTLKRHERRVKTAKTLTGVGLGLTLIPVVGWVVGPAMAIGGTIKLVDASRAVKIAEAELKKLKNQVDRYTDKVSDHTSKIFKSKLHISKVDHKLEWIHEKIQMVKKLRRFVAELQRETRSAVHLLSVLSGKVNVLEKQTRKFVLNEPVIKVIEEVLKSTEEITGNELLSDKDMLKLIKKMRENNQPLTAVCASQNNEEDKSFLFYLVFFSTIFLFALYQVLS